MTNAEAKALCPRTCIDCCCQEHHWGDYGPDLDENGDTFFDSHSLHCKHCSAKLDFKEPCLKCGKAFIDHDTDTWNCDPGAPPNSGQKFTYLGQPKRECVQVHPWDKNLGPGDVDRDNRPDEPACDPHGDNFMWDGGTDAECVACLRSKLETANAAYERAMVGWKGQIQSHNADKDKITRLEAEFEDMRGQRDLNFNNNRYSRKLFEEEREKLEVTLLQVGELTKGLKDAAFVLHAGHVTDPMDSCPHPICRQSLLLLTEKRIDPAAAYCDCVCHRSSVANGTCGCCSGKINGG